MKRGKHQACPTASRVLRVSSSLGLSHITSVKSGAGRAESRRRAYDLAEEWRGPS